MTTERNEQIRKTIQKAISVYRGHEVNVTTIGDEQLGCFHVEDDLTNHEFEKHFPNESIKAANGITFGAWEKLYEPLLDIEKALKAIGAIVEEYSEDNGDPNEYVTILIADE